MFISDELIYIQMQKTAGSHIAKLLRQLFDGEMIGKHNPATLEQIKSGAYFVGSIRNPWEWYLSLWTFGVGGFGTVMRNLTKRNILPAMKILFKNPKTGYQHCLDAITKDVKTWRGVYTHSDDITAFRRWLVLLHDSNQANHITKHYHSNIAQQFGWMTYTYLCLYCHADKPLSMMDFSQFAQLCQFEQDTCYIDDFIRQEALEQSLCNIIEKIRPLNAIEKSLIMDAKTTNTSHRALAISDYYDQACIELIQNRDKLIIEKFGYLPPE